MVGIYNTISLSYNFISKTYQKKKTIKEYMNFLIIKSFMNKSYDFFLN